MGDGILCKGGKVPEKGKEDEKNSRLFHYRKTGRGRRHNGIQHRTKEVAEGEVRFTRRIAKINERPDRKKKPMVRGRGGAYKQRSVRVSIIKPRTRSNNGGGGRRYSKQKAKKRKGEQGN